MIRLACLSLMLVSTVASAQSYNRLYDRSYMQPPVQSQQPSARLDFDHGVSAAEAGNYAEAYCIWKPLADVGHAEAQYRLGWLYAKGLGLAVNEATAVNWWKLAAELGHADALFRIGWAYEHGEGVEKDLTQAIKYYLAAAGNGQEDAVDILQILLSRDNKEVREGVGKILAQNPKALGKLTSISVKKANVRNQSNKNGKLITTLKEGDQLVVLGSNANWLRVWLVEKQQFGWIYNRLVSGYK